MRLKTLNGAPVCEQLDFNESNLLDPNDCNAFGATVPYAASQNNTATALKWRRLTGKDTRLRSGWSQPHLPRAIHDYEQLGLSFSLPNADLSLTFPEDDTSNLSTAITAEEQSSETDGFLQHSLIFHDTLLSSQVLKDTPTDISISSSSCLTTSFDTTTSVSSKPGRAHDHNSRITMVPSTIVTTPLGSLLSARHLRSIYPQTLTPNLLCVLTTRPQRREVFVKKNGGYKMHIWEIIVADDTRSGFKVSFWVRPVQQQNNEQGYAHTPLLHTLERLRVGDILLLRNIALTSFRDMVHGQSLNPAITRARTTIDVLLSGSGVLVGQVDGLPATLKDTFIRVKRWARSHIAAGHIESRKRKGSPLKRDEQLKRPFTSPEYDNSLPPDTLEAL
ncbi:hypothetical protein BKA66DRAFT_446861 [Pyrenochaeta sp. MPI-SDFR-AT-0127]|nr:hypothetical protein BKA66DRAFT_446861 [Pyrenochaeta sp. MPI-SDFR-AT-0127]